MAGDRALRGRYDARHPRRDGAGQDATWHRCGFSDDEAFLTLALVQLWHVFNMADRRAPTFINEITTNRAVWLALAICLALLWIACNVPFVARILQLSAPDARQWGFALALSFAAFLLGRGAVWLAGVLRRPPPGRGHA